MPEMIVTSVGLSSQIESNKALQSQRSLDGQTWVELIPAGSFSKLQSCFLEMVGKCNVHVHMNHNEQVFKQIIYA